MFQLDTNDDISSTLTLNESSDESYVERMSDIVCDVHVASSFLLFKATGLQTTFSLNTEVTHILCNIFCDFLLWEPNISIKIFADERRGAALMKKISFMKKEKEHDILLVSPAWIRKQWTGKYEKVLKDHSTSTALR
jgi:hypothetical protein